MTTTIPPHATPLSKTAALDRLITTAKGITGLADTKAALAAFRRAEPVAYDFLVGAWHDAPDAPSAATSATSRATTPPRTTPAPHIPSATDAAFAAIKRAAADLRARAPELSEGAAMTRAIATDPALYERFKAARAELEGGSFARTSSKASRDRG